MMLNVNTRLQYIIKLQYKQPRLDLTSLDFAKLSTTRGPKPHRVEHI